MLQNLDHAYARQSDFRRAVATLDLLIAGAPEIGPWYKRRGVFLVELGRRQAARRDFEKYLELEPAAPDREQIQEQIEALGRPANAGNGGGWVN